MTEQIQVVLLTYWRRATTGVLPVTMCALALLGAVALALLPMKSAATSVWFAMYGPGLIAIHLKQQVVHVRERRLPRAMVPHLGVAIALLLLIGLGIPLGRMIIVGDWCWGYPGLTFALAGVTFAGMISSSQLLSLLLVLAFWSAFTPAVQQWLALLCQGQLEQSGVLLMVVGIVSIGATVNWLLRITEEDRGYHVFTAGKPGDLYRREPVETSQSEAIRQMWSHRRLMPGEPSARTISQWGNWARGSLWQRMKLWEIGRSNPGAMLAVVLFPLGIVIPQLFISHRFDLANASNTFVILPAFILMGVWSQQRAMWAMEILRPVERREFVRVMGLNMARSAVVVWLLLVGTCVGAASIFSPDEVTGPVLIRFLVLTASGQVLVFAVGAWVLRYRSPVYWLAGFFITMWVVTIFSFMTNPNMTNPNRPAVSDPNFQLAALLVTALITALVLWDAYRRWLKTELG